MSEVRDPDTDQVAPEPNDLPSMHDVAIDMIQSRKEMGLRKYQSLLQPDNGRSFVQDAIEETVDQLVYLLGIRYEADHPDDTWLGALCWTLMNGEDWSEVTHVPEPVRDMLTRMELAINTEENPEVGS